MLITKHFAWAHLPKAAGDATQQMFAAVPGLIEWADSQDSAWLLRLDGHHSRERQSPGGDDRHRSDARAEVGDALDARRAGRAVPGGQNIVC